jgi:hypothetical protein
MKRGKKLTFSVKSVQSQVPTLIGGAAALAANPIVDPIIGGNPYIASLAKGAVGLLALSTGNQIAQGFGTVMAAYGVGQLINAASNSIFKREIPGLPSVAGIPGANTFDVYQIAGSGTMNGYASGTPNEALKAV